MKSVSLPNFEPTISIKKIYSEAKYLIDSLEFFKQLNRVEQGRVLNY